MKTSKFQKGDRVLRTKTILGTQRMAISYIVADVFEGVVTLESEKCLFTFSAYTGNALCFGGANPNHKIEIV